MSGTKLREAARVLRERAEDATPGPWKRCNVYGYKIVGPNLTPTVGHVDPAQGASRPRTVQHAVIESTNGSNGDYIATMHPGVGIALAGVLSDLADRADEIASTIGSDRVAASVIANTLTGWDNAVAAADAVLAGRQP